MPNDAADTRFWDRAARKYAASPIKDMPGYERTLDRVRQLLRPTDTVLEIGCGTGTTALKLAPAVAHLTATDVSGEMIAIARDKAAAQGCANVEFSATAADAAPGADGAYDAVLAFNLLHLITDRTPLYARIRQQLKPGGLFISKTPCLSDMNPLIRLAVPLMQLVGLAPSVASFSAAGLETELTAAGFTFVERARHGSGRKDVRIFLVVRNP